MVVTKACYFSNLVSMQTSYLTIPELAPVLVNAALQCVYTLGPTQKSRWSRPADFAVLGTIEIAYQEPDTLTHTSCHQLRIWKDRKAVLHATWDQEPSGPYKVLKLHQGAWVDEILQAAEFVALNAANA
jgi:hypothetical protein